MTEEPILSFDDIISVNTIDELRILYSHNSQYFSSEDEFLKRVKKDWKTEKKRLQREAQETDIPKELPSLDVVVDKTIYEIYGIHDLLRFIFGFGRNYKELVSGAIKDGNNWLYQQGLGGFFKKKRIN